MPSSLFPVASRYSLICVTRLNHMWEFVEGTEHIFAGPTKSDAVQSCSCGVTLPIQYVTWLIHINEFVRVRCVTLPIQYVTWLIHINEFVRVRDTEHIFAEKGASPTKSDVFKSFPVMWRYSLICVILLNYMWKICRGHRAHLRRERCESHEKWCRPVFLLRRGLYVYVNICIYRRDSISHVTHVNQCIVTRLMWRDSLGMSSRSKGASPTKSDAVQSSSSVVVYLTWLIYSYVWYELFICDVTHEYVTWLMDMWRDSLISEVTHLFICVVWIVHTWRDSLISDVTHGYVMWLMDRWRDSWICDVTHGYVTSLIYSYVCDMTYLMPSTLSLPHRDLYNVTHWVYLWEVRVQAPLKMMPCGHPPVNGIVRPTSLVMWHEWNRDTVRLVRRDLFIHICDMTYSHVMWLIIFGRDSFSCHATWGDSLSTSLRSKRASPWLV